MKITSKGQVTIPQAVREQAQLHPHSEVEFEVRAKPGPDGGFEVILKPAQAPATSLRAALERVRGSANAAQFKGMGTDEFMAFLRG
jgi:AbrB family looped-hinge helix DNA binding protein